MAGPGSGAERGAALRALAARALARVHAGASLREVLERARERLPEARDRAFLSALLYAALRAHFRHHALLRRMLERLPAEGSIGLALLHLGLTQLEALALPAHAAVSATAEAARRLRLPPLVPLLNAVLRRFLRERDALLAAAEADEEARVGHPRWLSERLARDWGETATAIMAANLAPAPLWLRLNRRRAIRERLLAALAERGVQAQADPYLADAVRLTGTIDPRALPGYAEGWFAVQDGAGQWAAELLAPPPGARVLDACAAPGGKTAALLAAGDLELTALERDPARLGRLRENLARLGLEARVLQADATRPESFFDGRRYERILLDAPCSATGVIRRQPDVLLHRRPEDLPSMVESQRALLEALWPLLAPGGRLLYATCSVLRDENDRLVGAFLDQHRDARAVPLALPVGRPLPPGWQILPGEGGMDGFFMALLERDPARAGGLRP
jgi:16S rRNA (cytosine967-C5)-methyltransferase